MKSLHSYTLKIFILIFVMYRDKLYSNFSFESYCNKIKEWKT